jgi:hypothetical protein
MLFHDPQSGHFPSHLGDWLPHFWQAKMVLCFTDSPRKYQMSYEITASRRALSIGRGTGLMV